MTSWQGAMDRKSEPGVERTAPGSLSYPYVSKESKAAWKEAAFRKNYLMRVGKIGLRNMAMLGAAWERKSRFMKQSLRVLVIKIVASLLAVILLSARGAWARPTTPGQAKVAEGSGQSDRADQGRMMG